MASVRIDNFGGLVLTKDQKKGPFWTAMKCQNCDVQSGSVNISYTLDLANALPLSGTVGRKTIYNITGTTFLEWTQTVDIARSPLADNSSHRIYFTGAGVPQVTDASMATAGTVPYPASSFVLGIPIMPALYTVTEAVASGATAETRAYTYTWLSPWAEESAPASPMTVTTHVTGVTINLHGMGVTTRGFNGATQYGLGVSALTYVAGSPGVLRCPLTVAGYQNDIRVGDRVYLWHSTVLTDQRTGSYIVGAVNPAGTGTIDLVGNVWDTNSAAALVLLRVLPVNTYNIVAVAVDSPAVGQCKVFVDTVEGLRAGESLAITGTGGIAGLNATFTVSSVSATSTDPLTDPYFVIPLATSGSLTGASTSVATRTAKHNTGDTRITALSFAAGIATAVVDSTAHMNVGDSIVIAAVMGAWQANGKRTLLSVTPATNTITFALTAMSAYTGGGRAILNTPWPMPELSVTGVSVIGGAAPYTVQIFMSSPPNAVFAAGDMVLGYDIGGSVECNNVMRAHAVTAGYIEVLSAVSPTAFTAGGKVLNLKPQNRKRVYRTGTGTTGNAEYQLVAELSGDRAYYIDTVETAGLGNVLESDEWIQPPVDMHSIVAHPGGFLMGLSGNVICKSEAYHPHAWPLSLQQSLPADGVGMSIYGTTAVVMTNVIPFNVTGYDPGSMRIERQDVGEPCTAHRSVTATGLGVSYRGTSGIFLIGYDGSENATRNYLPPALFLAAADTIAAYWGNKLIWIDATTQAGYIFDPVRSEKGLTEFSLDYPVYGLHVSPVDGKLYASYLDGTTPKRAPLFSIVTNPAKFTYWTQYILLPRPVNLAWLQVDWAWGGQSAAMKLREDVLSRNIRRRPIRGRTGVGLTYVGEFELAGDDLEVAPMPDRSISIPTEQYLHVTVIANPDRPDVAVTVFDDYVVNELPVGMAEGIEADTWQVKFEGNAKVTAVSIAETLEELGES